jgi:co-chaperonin GroES (HSP10)
MSNVVQAHKIILDKPIRRRFSVRTPAGKRSETWVNVVHKEDPKEAILRKIGTIPEGLVQFSRILVAIYQPPLVEKSSGGVIFAQTIQEEDKMEALWQGKVGLLVAKGPQSYVDDENTKFHGTSNEVGDWVWFRPSDGMGCDVSEVFCRILSERDIIGKLPHPDMVV